MLTRDVYALIKQVSRESSFLPLGDFLEVMEYGAGPHYALKFSGPCNGVSQQSEYYPVVHERDFARLALFFLVVAKDRGLLGDIELAIREVLFENAREKVGAELEKQDKKNKQEEKTKKENQVINDAVLEEHL